MQDFEQKYNYEIKRMFYFIDDIAVVKNEKKYKNWHIKQMLKKNYNMIINKNNTIVTIWEKRW